MTMLRWAFTPTVFVCILALCYATHDDPGSFLPDKIKITIGHGRSQSFPQQSLPSPDNPGMPRHPTFTIGDRNQPEEQRISLPVTPAKTVSKLSWVQSFNEITNEIAKPFLRAHPTIGPAESSVPQETVTLSNSQAKLLQDLQRRFPDVTHDQVEQEKPGPLAKCFRPIADCFRPIAVAIRHKAQDLCATVLPFCSKDDDKDLLFSKRSNEETWAGKSLDDVLKDLGTNSQSGLTTEQVEKKQAQFGLNVLDKPQPVSYFKILLNAIKSIVVIMMFIGILALFGTKSFIEGSVMLIFLLIVLVMGTVPEYISERQADNMAIDPPVDVLVKRDNELKMVPSSELVPGDIITLKVGDRVPADCRVVAFEDKQFSVAEAELTGESELLPKIIDAVTSPGPSGTYDNMILMGTLVASGKSTAVVVETGMNARYGSIQNLLIMKDRKATPITDKVEALVAKFFKIILAVSVLLGTLFLLLKRDPNPDSHDNRWLKVALLMLSVCIAVVPEGLAISCTLALNQGMSAMLQKCNTRVRTMSAVECLSAVDVFCTDKTGTLTTGQMKIMGVYVLDSEFRLLADGTAMEGDICADPVSVQSQEICTNSVSVHAVASNRGLKLLMHCAALCNSAELLEDKTWSGQASDKALAEAAHHYGVDLQGFVKLHTNPFDSMRKMMSVVVDIQKNRDIFKQHQLPQNVLKCPYAVIVKGAPEIILERCTEMYQSDGEITQMSEEDQKRLEQRFANLSSSGYRVLAVAYRSFELVTNYNADDLEERLIFIGFAAMKDPLRETVKDTVLRLHQAGIAVKMITGDSLVTGTAIARQAGILVDDANPNVAIESADLRKAQHEIDLLKFKQHLLRYKKLAKDDPKLSSQIRANLDAADTLEDITEKLIKAQTELDNTINQGLVFARAQPEDKVIIVEALQRLKHIVAMTGDGVNDAPALKKANAGIAVFSATDLTKRAAPINILDAKFDRVAETIAEGRRVALNMFKAVFCVFAANTGELFPIFVQLFGFPPPLRTLQVLWLNAFTDIGNIVPLAWDEPFRDLMSDPPIPSFAPILHSRNWFQVAVLSLLTGVGGFGIQAFALKRKTGDLRGHVPDPHAPASEEDYRMASTAVMTFMVISQLLLSYTCRSLDESVLTPRRFFQNLAMHAAVIVSGILTIGVPYIPKLSGWLSMQSMPLDILMTALALSLSLPLGHEFLKAMFKILAIGRKRAPLPDDAEIGIPVHRFKPKPLTNSKH